MFTNLSTIADVSVLLCCVTYIVITIVVNVRNVIVTARMNSENKELQKTRELAEMYKAEYDKVLHQKKSSEVRLGKVAENMAPFFDAWPYDPNNFRFLGNPVDGIQFTEDSVIFIEIKSGKARLSSSQKLIKDLVRRGKVEFATFRVDGNGCLLKIEDSM